MKYFYLEPEVAGGLGEDTELNSDTHPPIVSRLEYEFDDWAGDAILESFPCFIVTEDCQRVLIGLTFTGISYGAVKISKSEEFGYFHPDVKLPPFVWLKVNGEAGRDDFGIAEDYRLVVSEKAIEVLRQLGISHAEIEPFDLPKPHEEDVLQ